MYRVMYRVLCHVALYVNVAAMSPCIETLLSVHKLCHIGFIHRGPVYKRGWLAREHSSQHMSTVNFYLNVAANVPCRLAFEHCSKRTNLTHFNVGANVPCNVPFRLTCK